MKLTKYRHECTQATTTYVVQQVVGGDLACMSAVISDEAPRKVVAKELWRMRQEVRMLVSMGPPDPAMAWMQSLYAEAQA